MEETKVFEGLLENDVEYELHVSKSFAGRPEVALKIAGEVVSVIVVEIKRSGNISCKPANARTVLIKRCSSDEPEGKLPSMDDVLDEEEENSEIIQQ